MSRLNINLNVSEFPQDSIIIGFSLESIVLDLESFPNIDISGIGNESFVDTAKDKIDKAIKWVREKLKKIIDKIKDIYHSNKYRFNMRELKSIAQMGSDIRLRTYGALRREHPDAAKNVSDSKAQDYIKFKIEIYSEFLSDHDLLKDIKSCAQLEGLFDKGCKALISCWNNVTDYDKYIGDSYFDKNLKTLEYTFTEYERIIRTKNDSPLSMQDIDRAIDYISGKMKNMVTNGIKQCETIYMEKDIDIDKHSDKDRFTDWVEKITLIIRLSGKLNSLLLIQAEIYRTMWLFLNNNFVNDDDKTVPIHSYIRWTNSNIK